MFRTTHVEHIGHIFGRVQGDLVLGRDIGLVPTQALSRPIADCKHEAKVNNLVNSELKKPEMMSGLSYPSHKHEIVVRGDFTHHSQARHKAKRDKDRGEDEKDYSHYERWCSAVVHDDDFFVVVFFGVYASPQCNVRKSCGVSVPVGSSIVASPC